MCDKMLKTKKTINVWRNVSENREKEKGLQAQRTFFDTFDMQGCVSDQIEPGRACHDAIANLLRRLSSLV